ncbi:uncharacterized protein G6M90_00g050850 [Metarhizium brunneum]|uniref:Uncharacterized protein n=1 Tax=Metarhizium brunneum TaxID=500148 RepID=A0A7D5UVN8_9HYPO|nr:hypothetical protein G6M90_00g050850 [Metarhizium brunneum]
MEKTPAGENLEEFARGPIHDNDAVEDWSVGDGIPLGTAEGMEA